MKPQESTSCARFYFLIIMTIIIIIRVLLGNPLHPKEGGNIYNKRVMTMLASSVLIIFQAHPMQTLMFPSNAEVGDD